MILKFLIATIFSVLGGVIGYLIGSYFFDVGIQIVNFYSYENKLLNLKNNLINSESFYAWLGVLFLADSEQFRQERYCQDR